MRVVELRTYYTKDSTLTICTIVRTVQNGKRKIDLIRINRYYLSINDDRLYLWSIFLLPKST